MITSRTVVLTAAASMTAVLTAFQVAASAPNAVSPQHPLGQGSVWDSVFTLAQASRGESTFKSVCSNCHGDQLAGLNDAPALTGPTFHKTWDGNALSAFFNRIRNDMPSDNPGSLEKPQVAELVAFVLKFNGYPAGKLDLPAAAESLSTIRITAKP